MNQASPDAPLDDDGAANPQPYETKLRHVSDELNRGQAVSAAPREILEWFGVKRRGIHVVARIHRALQAAGLTTTPSFEHEFMDGEVQFQLAGKGPAVTKLSTTRLDGISVEVDAVVTNRGTDPADSEITSDPTYRIGKLAAANTRPISVKPDTDIKTAVTLMMSNDFSQVPVMAGERDVKGLLSWQSLGEHIYFKKSVSAARECMVECHVISSEMSIFDAVGEIVRHGVVLIRNAKDRSISGIVTTTDLSLQFRQLGEPFLVLGEIENHVRLLLDGCFTKEELGKIRDPDDADRNVEGIADLTFGEYLRLVENEARWDKLGIPLDRKAFISGLDTVRVIRNDVMHFDPDGISTEDLSTLRKFAAFLRSISGLRESRPSEGGA